MGSRYHILGQLPLLYAWRKLLVLIGSTWSPCNLSRTCLPMCVYLRDILYSELFRIAIFSLGFPLLMSLSVLYALSPWMTYVMNEGQWSSPSHGMLADWCILPTLWPIVSMHKFQRLKASSFEVAHCQGPTAFAFPSESTELSAAYAFWRLLIITSVL